MSPPAVAAEIHEALDIHGYLAPPVTLDDVVIFNDGSNPIDIVST